MQYAFGKRVAMSQDEAIERVTQEQVPAYRIPGG